ncbi:AEC family transporter [Erwiniaceae bacterium BAC15a-03b]|uniref:AEC family transporter n=1 Tax=Winslowiella arboricola TaxID=2978220 RepID=A0A9J6PVP4_9GAMM|nr:AEC family transporter [Winslowiella arboricola]MCU5772433.1 AEC family transporter [Winslowiella arboricola]MCU5779773.1 AEC family transporter [Winslowiella arboricola]
MPVTGSLTDQLTHQIYLSVPLFILIFTGYGLSKFAQWPATVTEALNRFCFNVALPCMLFTVMSQFYTNPPVDARLLFAFFGSCLLVYLLGRIIAARVFALDGVSGSVFALGGVFSNNVMLGIPVATILLGQESLPSVALVLVFNGLILWTLVTVSVEWARTGNFSLPGIGRTLLGVLRNPLIIGIMLGFAWSALHRPLPYVISAPVNMLAQIAAPLSLVTLGMSLAGYKISEGLRESYAICILKLLVQPLVIWLLAWSIDLPLHESRVVVLLGSMAVGVNVYLMSQKFQVLQGASATSLLFSTVLSALTTPLFMMLMTLYYV